MKPEIRDVNNTQNPLVPTEALGRDSRLTWKKFVLIYTICWAITMTVILTVAYLVLPHN